MKFFPSVVIWSLLLLCSHFPRAICSDAEDSEEYYDDVLDGVLPAILDRSDIGYFYQQGLDDLADILQFIFDRSTRTPNDDDTTDEYTVDHELSPRLTARGAGYAYTTRTKLQHDLDQALYLAKTIPDETEAAFFRKVAASRRNGSRLFPKSGSALVCQSPRGDSLRNGRQRNSHL